MPVETDRKLPGRLPGRTHTHTNTHACTHTHARTNRENVLLGTWVKVTTELAILRDFIIIVIIKVVLFFSVLTHPAKDPWCETLTHSKQVHSNTDKGWRRSPHQCWHKAVWWHTAVKGHHCLLPGLQLLSSKQIIKQDCNMAETESRCLRGYTPYVTTCIPSIITLQCLSLFLERHIYSPWCSVFEKPLVHIIMDGMSKTI